MDESARESSCHWFRGAEGRLAPKDMQLSRVWREEKMLLPEDIAAPGPEKTERSQWEKHSCNTGSYGRGCDVKTEHSSGPRLLSQHPASLDMKEKSFPSTAISPHF